MKMKIANEVNFFCTMDPSSVHFGPLGEVIDTIEKPISKQLRPAFTGDEKICCTHRFIVGSRLLSQFNDTRRNEYREKNVDEIETLI